MAEDPAREYMDRRIAFDDSTKRTQDLVDVIVNAGSHLSHEWHSMSVSNIDVSLPEAVQGAIIDADKWPTARELAQALEAWHKAYSDLKDAWAAVSDRDRGTLQPPPDYTIGGPESRRTGPSSPI